MAAALISCGAFVPLAVKWPLYARRVSQITVKALVTSSIIQSVCLVGNVWIRTANKLFFCLGNRQKLVRIRFKNVWYTHIYRDFPINNIILVKVGMYVLENELLHGELKGLFISSLI